MKRRSRSPRPTVTPKATLIRSPVVSYADEMLSLWGRLTRAVSTTRMPTNSVRRRTATIRRPAGISQAGNLASGEIPCAGWMALARMGHFRRRPPGLIPGPAGARNRKTLYTASLLLGRSAPPVSPRSAMPPSLIRSASTASLVDFSHFILRVGGGASSSPCLSGRADALCRVIVHLSGR